MNTSSLVALAREAARLILAPTLTILVLTAAVCWIAGWRTLDQLGGGLLIAGGLTFGAGAAGMLGGRALDGSYRYIVAGSVSSEDLESRKLRRMADNGASFGFLLHSVVIAAMLFALALAIRGLS